VVFMGGTGNCGFPDRRGGAARNPDGDPESFRGVDASWRPTLPSRSPDGSRSPTCWCRP